MGNFIVSLNIELEDTDKDPEMKVQSMKEQFPELETYTPELRTLFTARSLPFIKIVSVTTFCNANNSGRTVNRIVEVADEILPEVQIAILNIVNCLKPENREDLEMKLLYQQMSMEAAEKYIKEYFEMYSVRPPAKQLRQTPRVLWMDRKYIDIGHGGSCEVMERIGLIINAQ